MCGRFTLTTDIGPYFDLFDLQLPEQLSQPRLFNIAPSQPVLGLVSGPSIEADIMEWGFLPSWAKPDGKYRAVINARGETVAEKPFFRGAFKSNRCAILADGFYEWRREAGGKTPYWITLEDERVFAMAGLRSRRTTVDGSEQVGCAIVTTGPNALMADIHDRMPVILDPDDVRAWLDREAQPGELQKLIHSFPADGMKAHAVSTRVNIPANDSPENIEPV